MLLFNKADEGSSGDISLFCDSTPLKKKSIKLCFVKEDYFSVNHC